MHYIKGKTLNNFIDKYLNILNYLNNTHLIIIGLGSILLALITIKIASILTLLITRRLYINIMNKFELSLNEVADERKINTNIKE